MNFLTFRSRSHSRKTSTNMMISNEKWRYSHKMSRRDNIFFIDEDQEDDDDEPQFKEVADWIQECFAGKNETTDTLDQDIEVQLTKKQTLILSTLVPDEILQMDKFDSSQPKRFVGVLMMADVSGYTALSERYSNTGKGGAYRLTVTLNTYLGSLIEVIYRQGGDVIKFAGDAFLALWKTDKRTFLCQTIHKVIACALIIQNSYAVYETDVKVNLKVKLAISAGNLIFSVIGTGLDMNYIIFGLPVLEAKAAESICCSGEIKLTPTAWGHCYSRNYDHHIDEKGYVTIKSILYDPHDSNITKPFSGFGKMITQIKKPFTAIESLPDYLWDLSKELSASEVLKKSEALSLRKIILLTQGKDLGADIRKFMIRPVLTQIDAHQPLEYLTEMRDVSILFITFKAKNFSFAQLATIVNNAYQITCEIVYKSMGCVNKIILFDKDVMMLVVFGLRGFKHESEAQAALKCAYSIKKSVSVLDGVIEVSIGVTTGRVYCGVVGHPLRREFTVIGAVVNKAARLMCGFKNIITCDETTFVKCKMSTNAFTLQPSIELKGIGNPGKIYEYCEDIRVKEIYDIPMIAPLLNRVDEIEYFNSWLEESDQLHRDFDALLILGESRIGKSRILEWMARCAKNKGYHVCKINLTSIHASTAYLALSQVINQILGLEEPVPGFTKEEKIVQLLKVYSDELCYLNNIIKVRFAYHEGIHSLDEHQRRDKAKHVFMKLIRALTEKQVIFLDDLQNLDQFSWEFLSMMFDSPKIFIVFTITRRKFSTVHNWLYKVLMNNNVRKMSLGSLDSEWIPALACQILDVDGVANELCNTLRTKSRGIPGIIETFIIHLFSNGALEKIYIPNDDINIWKIKEDLIFPNQLLLHPQALNLKDQENLNQFIENDSKDNKSICIVTKKDKLKTNFDDQNREALIMIQIDSLTPYQQLLLKIASVIGNIIPRTLLENIMYENNCLITAKAVKRLFFLNIFMCANADYLFRRKHKVTDSTPNSANELYNPNLTCCCKFEYIQEECENLPKYAFCTLMKFRNRNSRKTCYDLLPLNQKREFHTRIVNYLENNKHKCTDCGGKTMLVQSWESVLGNPSIENNILTSTDSSSAKLKLSDNNSENSLTKTERHPIANIDSSIYLRGSTPILTASKQIISPTKATSELSFNYKDNIEFNEGSAQYQTISEFRQNEELCKMKNVTLTSTNLFPNCPVEANVSKLFDMLREITEAKNLNDWHNLRVFDSQEDIREASNFLDNKSFHIKIAKEVPETNFTTCTCAELNIAICEQLVYHAQQADLKIKAIEFLLKYCYFCILSNNIDNIFSKIEEAEEMCLGILDSFEKKRFFGKLHSLRASVCLTVGKLTAAKLAIKEANKIYGITTTKFPNCLKLRNMTTFMKCRRKKYHIQHNILKADSIFCLNVSTLLYSMLGDERKSKMSALRALNTVQNIDCSVIIICDAFSIAIQLELDRGTPENTAYIEHMATQRLKQLTNGIEADELFALGKLFMIIFCARIFRGQLAPSIRSGYRALVISRFIQTKNLALEIIPDLFYILLARRRIDEAVNILQYALCSRNQYCTLLEYETWYYALCLDMILDAGFELESPEDISCFAEHAMIRGKAASESRRRLIVGLWTYWLRTGLENKAKYFESKALSWLSHEDSSSMTSLLSAMRLAEGMLESLARKVDDLRKVVDMMQLHSIADRELARLENDARLIRSIYPRWSLLKAHSCKLSGRISMANGFFNQTLEEAQRIDNRLEESLARAATLNSTIWIQNARANSFCDWRAGAQNAKSSWHELMYNISTSRK